MTNPQQPDSDRDRARFRRTLIGVMAAQVITLLMLWMLQARYTD